MDSGQVYQTKTCEKRVNGAYLLNDDDTEWFGDDEGKEASEGEEMQHEMKETKTVVGCTKINANEN